MSDDDQDFTVILVVEPPSTMITLTLNAHCEKCAFVRTLEIISERKKEIPDARTMHVMAILPGHHENLWPKVESSIRKMTGINPQAFPISHLMRSVDEIPPDSIN